MESGTNPRSMAESSPAVAAADSAVVERAIALWNRLLERGDTALQTRHALMEAVRERGLMYGDRPISTFLRPRFIDAATWHQCERVGAWFHVSLTRMMRHLAADAAALDDLGIHGRLQEMVRASAPHDDTLYFVRLDGFLDHGVIRFVEFNADSPGGAAFVDGFGEVYATLPIFQEFSREVSLWRRPSTPSMRHAVAHAAARAGISRPRVAIVDWREVATINEFRMIADDLTRHGTPAVVCDPRDMELRGDRLTVNGEPVDLILKRVLVTDLATRHEEARALIDAMQRRLVVSLNPIACQAVTPKSLLALFWEGRVDHLLSRRARAMWERHVPFTLRVREGRIERDGGSTDIMPWIVDHRENLVLKPADAWGAEGVRLGWKCTQSDWEAAVAEGLRLGDWVVQERIGIPLEDFPDADEGVLRYQTMRTEISPYTFHPRTTAEVLARLSSNDLMNVKTGGGVVTTYVVR